MDPQIREIIDRAKGISPAKRKRLDAANSLATRQLWILLRMSQKETETYGALSSDEMQKKKLLPPPTQREIAENPDDFIKIPNGALARRCTAKAKSTQQRCRHVATRGKTKCKFHGGLSTGARTVEGRKRLSTRLKHGRETIVKRERRRAKLRWLRDIERLSQELGIMG